MARNGSLPIIKEPFPQQHVVVGQLGLKLQVQVPRQLQQGQEALIV